MGSRTTLSLKPHYGKFHSINKNSGFLPDVQKNINKNYNLTKASSENEFQESLKSFGEKLVINAAKSYLIHFTPVVGDIYHAYQFAKVSYDYYEKVKTTYDNNGGNLESALIDSAVNEVKDLAPNFVKSMVLQTTIDSSWEGFKENHNVDVKNPAMESVIKSALYDTMGELIK